MTETQTFAYQHQPALTHSYRHGTTLCLTFREARHAHHAADALGVLLERVAKKEAFAAHPRPHKSAISTLADNQVLLRPINEATAAMVMLEMTALHDEIQGIPREQGTMEQHKSRLRESLQTGTSYDGSRQMQEMQRSIGELGLRGAQHLLAREALAYAAQIELDRRANAVELGARIIG